MKLIDYYTQHEVEEIIRRIHVCYFSLLVRLSQQSQDISVSKTENFIKLFLSIKENLKFIYSNNISRVSILGAVYIGHDPLQNFFLLV